MRSYRSCAGDAYCCRDMQCALSREAHGEFEKFSLHCSVALPSMSMPVISAWGKRCASIRAIRPLPLPISNSWLFSFLPNSVHAPSNTPSVPTFMAHALSSTANCLKRNAIKGSQCVCVMVMMWSEYADTHIDAYSYEK